MAQTVVLLHVPDVDPVVEMLRRTVDARHARVTPVLSHVTLLGPFLELAHIDEIVLNTLGDIFARVAPLRLTLREVRSFESGVVYLAAEPKDELLRLSASLSMAFPQCPPYRGQFADLTPHVTLASDADRRGVAAITDATRARLPIAAKVTHATLLCPEAGSARNAVATFPLRGPRIRWTAMPVGVTPPRLRGLLRPLHRQST